MKTQVWIHGGTSAHTPENTLETFSLAVEQGADEVELDVRLTRDHQLVITHGETIGRVSDGFGYIKDHTLSQLKKLHFNELFPEYRQASIPTLGEVHEPLKPTGLVVNVELKTGIVRCEGIEEGTLSPTAEMRIKGRIVYFSFYHPSLVRPRELDPSVYTGLLYSDGWLDVASYGGNRVHVNALHPTLYHVQGKDLVPAAMAWELRLHVWIVNGEPHMEILVKQDIEAIITNEPDLCRSVVDRVGRKDWLNGKISGS